MATRSTLTLFGAGLCLLASSSARAQSGPVVVVAAPPASVSGSVSVRVDPAARWSGQARREISEGFARVPLRVGVHAGLGWAGMTGAPALDGYATELGGSLGAWATPWLAVELRGSYLGLLRRVVDANGDGRADGGPSALEALLLTGQVRLRLSEDVGDARRGWSLSLGGGAMLPWANAEGRAPGPVLEGALARHLGVRAQNGSALDAAFELRARSGLAGLGDYQSLVAGISAAWEGGRPAGPAPRELSALGWRPGHTVGVHGLIGGALFQPSRAGAGAALGHVASGVEMSAGIVLAPGFELLARGGYLGRGPQRMGDDWLHAVHVGAGARARWWTFFAEAEGGLVAPFGTWRDRVTAIPFAGGALGARIPLGEAARGPGGWLVLGARGRVGLGEERAFDGIFATVGLEFEGGRLQPAVPRFAPPPVVVAPALVPSGVVVAPARVPAPSRVVVAPAPAPMPVAVAPARVPAQPVSAVNSGSSRIVVRESPRAIPSGPWRVSVPLRVSLGAGLGVGGRELGATALDGAGTTLQVSAAWVLAGPIALEATGALLLLRGRTADLNGDGVIERGSPDAVFGTVSFGPRLRVQRDPSEEHARYGWSLLLAGGLLATPQGVGPLGEVAIGHHLATITDSQMAFELGIEARGRLGWIPAAQTAGGSAALYPHASVALTGAWEGAARRSLSSARGLGLTLGLEAHFGLALQGPVGRRATLSPAIAGVAARAGVVFTPGFEWGLRGAYLSREGARGSATHTTLLAETGPRARWGWTFGELMLGYASAVGAYREDVAGSLVGSVGGGLRFGLNGPGRHIGLSAGLLARFGLGPERAHDALFVTLALEFEAGGRQAAPFSSSPVRRASLGEGWPLGWASRGRVPDRDPVGSPSVRGTRVDASVSSTVSTGVAPPGVTPIEVTSPRYRATGGAVISPGATVSSAGSVVVPPTGTLTVGLAPLVPVVPGTATTVPQTVLVPGAIVDSTPFGATGFALDPEALLAMLPALDPRVSELTVELRTSALAGPAVLVLEQVLRDALARRYVGPSARVGGRVLPGASASGRFELTLRAR
jgi:hypothetical protein